MRSSIIIAALLAVAVGGWILSGQFGSDESQPNGEAEAAQATQDVPAETAVAEEEAVPKLMTVRIRDSIATPRLTEISLSGRTEANRQVTLRAETPGRIIKVETEKGIKVKRGEVIARIDMDARGAQLAEYKALVAQKQLEFDQASKLENKGFQSKTRVSQAAAELEQAKARLRMMEVEVADTVIKAPFGAQLQERPVEVGDFVNVGDHIATLVELDPIIIVGYLSERDVGLIEEGVMANADLVTGQDVVGVVKYVSRVSEETTRTFRVEVEAPNPGRRIFEGVTAEIRLPIESVDTHVVTPALLSLDDDGVVGVKAVTTDGFVKFYPVQIVEASPVGIWITGLPLQIDLITVGQDFVVDGEQVIAVHESEITARAGDSQ